MTLGLLLLNTLHWFAAVVMLGLVVYSWPYRRRPGVRPLICFFYLTGLWALSVAISFQITNLELAILMNRFKMLTVPFIPVAILAIALSLDRARRIPPWLWLIIFVIPSTTVGMLLSPWHHELLITGYQFISFGPHEVLAFENGPWFVVHLSQARILILVSFVLMYTARQDLSPLHKQKTGLISFSILLPFLVDSLGVMAFPNLRYLQMVPAFFLVTSLIMAYAVLRHKLLNVIPVARSRILDSSTDSFLVFDENKRLIDFNQQAEKIFCLSRSNLGQAYDSVLREYPDICDLVRENREFGVEWAEGGLIYETSTYPIMTASADDIGLSLVMRDITARKQAERELLELSEMKTKLLAIVGHDLQGNLASLALTANNLLKNREDLNPDIGAALEDIQYSTRDCISFVEDLIMWSKSQMGRFQILPVELDIRSMINETLKFLQGPILEKNLNVSLDQQGDAQIVADKNMVATVIRNLLQNAIKFSPVDGAINISLKQEGHRLVVNIEDQGHGVKLADQPQLFDLSRQDRSGLGLLLCAEFIQRLGGQIGYHDRKAGGAHFYFCLPLTTKAAKSSAPMLNLSGVHAPL